jgi:hypothetical protein
MKICSEESSVMQNDLDRSERALTRTAIKYTDSAAELVKCKFIAKRLSDAQTTCWLCQDPIAVVEMSRLNDNSPISDGNPVPMKMQCNGGHSICGSCANSLADNYLGDQQTKRMCCGFLTAWPGNKVSRRCDRLFCPSQMANVFSSEKLSQVEIASTLRKERALVASETLSRRDDVGASQSDQQDDMFTFKTPCCNIAWEADACMAVRCPGCERRFCQLCSRRMEIGMTSLQAHDHVRQCTFDTFNRAFVFPYEIDKKILPKKAVHLVMKANYSKMYQLQNFGEERLQHWNLATEDGNAGQVDVTQLTHTERQFALEVKITDVLNNPLAGIANANYNVRWDDVEAEEAQQAAVALVAAGGNPPPMAPGAGVDDSDNDSDSDDESEASIDNNGESGTDSESEDDRAPRPVRRAAQQGREAWARAARADADIRRMLREDPEAPEAPQNDDMRAAVEAVDAAVAQAEAVENARVRAGGIIVL